MKNWTARASIIATFAGIIAIMLVLGVVSYDRLRTIDTEASAIESDHLHRQGDRGGARRNDRRVVHGHSRRRDELRRRCAARRAGGVTVISYRPRRTWRDALVQAAAITASDKSARA
jgi:predicted Zn-dependent protease